MGPPVTPLQAPDDKLLHSSYCKGDERGECPSGGGGCAGGWTSLPIIKMHAWGHPPHTPLHPRDATIGLQCPQKGDQSQAGALFTLFPQPGTSVPIGAPRGLGAWPVVRGEGLLAGGGPALASGSAPLEEEVHKGLGAVQPWGSPPWPLSLWLLLLPLLLWGERGRDAISNSVWRQGTWGCWRATGGTDW